MIHFGKLQTKQRKTSREQEWNKQQLDRGLSLQLKGSQTHAVRCGLLLYFACIHTECRETFWLTITSWEYCGRQCCVYWIFFYDSAVVAQHHAPTIHRDILCSLCLLLCFSASVNWDSFTAAQDRAKIQKRRSRDSGETSVYPKTSVTPWVIRSGLILAGYSKKKKRWQNILFFYLR